LYYGGTGENVNAEHITIIPPEHTTITPKVTMTPPRHVTPVIWPPRHENNNNENRPEHKIPTLLGILHNRPYLADLYYGGTGENTQAVEVRPEIRPVVHTPYFRYNFLPFTHSYNPVIPKTQPMYQVVLDHNLLTL